VLVGSWPTVLRPNLLSVVLRTVVLAGRQAAFVLVYFLLEWCPASYIAGRLTKGLFRRRVRPATTCRLRTTSKPLGSKHRLHCTPTRTEVVQVHSVLSDVLILLLKDWSVGPAGLRYRGWLVVQQN